MNKFLDFAQGILLYSKSAGAFCTSICDEQGHTNSVCKLRLSSYNTCSLHPLHITASNIAHYNSFNN